MALLKEFLKHSKESLGVLGQASKQSNSQSGKHILFIKIVFSIKLSIMEIDWMSSSFSFF